MWTREYKLEKTRQQNPMVEWIVFAPVQTTTQRTLHRTESHISLRLWDHVCHNIFRVNGFATAASRAVHFQWFKGDIQSSQSLPTSSHWGKHCIKSQDYKTRGSGPKHDFVPIFLNAAEGIKSLINTHTQEYGQAVCPDLMLILKIFNNRLALVWIIKRSINHSWTKRFLAINFGF